MDKIKWSYMVFWRRKSLRKEIQQIKQELCDMSENAQPFFNLMNKDCFLAIKEIPENSVDLIITDPPYGINFTKGYKSGSTERTCYTL